MIDFNESATETKVEDIKYALTNTKYRFYIRYGEELVRYLIISTYAVVERFIVLGRYIHIIIRIKGIDP